MLRARVQVLALDVEGTLISNAVSQFARPGLHDFLEFCRSEFPRVLVYTRVGEQRFRKLAHQLILEKAAPPWFGNIPHLYWAGEHKDLRLVPGAAVETSLLVDDVEECVHPDQRDRWVRIEPFEQPYPVSDSELARVRGVLEGYLS